MLWIKGICENKSISILIMIKIEISKPIDWESLIHAQSF